MERIEAMFEIFRLQRPLPSVDVRHVSAQLSRTTTFRTTHAFGRRGFKCQTVTASLFKSPVINISDIVESTGLYVRPDDSFFE